MSAILAVENVSKAYGSNVPVLQNLRFQLEAGEFLAIVGPSGCGKSTLLRLISSLMQPSSGEVRHKDSVFAEPPKWLSIVFQDYNRSLFPWLTVRKNVEFGLRDVNNRERSDRVEEALDAVNLSNAADLYPWQISGGMQQRCALARSIVVRPELLLLDEPFASVDAQTRIDLQDMVIDICRKMSLTTLLVTHDIDEAVFMSDRILVLSTRPANIVEEIDVDIPYPRDQLTTKESEKFLTIRHDVYTSVRFQADSKKDKRRLESE